MTAALVRVCNKCKKEFLKEDGCNRMKCPCGNSQCYICSKDVEDYGHFDESECPLYESNEDAENRLRMAVGMAQKQAVRELLQTRNDVSKKNIIVDADLMGNKEERDFEDGVSEADQADPEIPGQEYEDEYSVGIFYSKLH